MMKHFDPKTEIVSPHGLIPHPANPRKHSRKQLRFIVRSIEKHGFTNPIIVDEHNVIICGHGRHQAALMAGLEGVPVIRLVGYSEHEKFSLMIADNRTGELSSWDDDMLPRILQNLVDAHFDTEDFGFETAEVDILLSHDDAATVDEADSVEEPDTTQPPVSRSGDLFLLGEHRLLCGDALKSESYEALLAGAKAGMVFTDPPWNVRIAGNVSGRGKVKHGDFAMASGEMTDAEYVAFLETCMSHLVAVSENGAIHFHCIDGRHYYELRKAAEGLCTYLNLCVWVKSNWGMGSLYRSQHELVAVLKVGDAPHINNIALGKHGRNRANVWHYSGANSMQKGRLADLKAHPTVKPVALVADAILDCSNLGMLVLDPFVGSGTTILACQRTQRRCAAIEIDPHYCDVAIKRFEERTGLSAVHEASGLTFAELAKLRLARGEEDSDRDE